MTLKHGKEIAMEKLGALIKSKPHLAKPQSGGTAMASRSEMQDQETTLWLRLLRQLAQEKRQDLAPGTREWWKAKLKDYQEPEICEAILLYSGEFFPDVDRIIEIIERKRQANADRKADMYWVEYERNNRDIDKFMAEHDGKTPMQVWAEENREYVEKLNALSGQSASGGVKTKASVNKHTGVSGSDERVQAPAPSNSAVHEAGIQRGDGAPTQSEERLEP